jgi:hypothetical protein
MNRSIRIFLGTSLPVFALLSASSVRAALFDREVSAFYCAPYASDEQFGPYSVTNLSPTTWKYYACPVPNDAQRNLRQIAAYSPIRLVGSATGSRKIQAWACLSHYATTGGACGTVADNGQTTGLVTLLPSGSAWLSASMYDTPYVALNLGPCTAVNGSCTASNLIRGIRVNYIDL